MCKNYFPKCFIEAGDLKVQLSWELKGVNIGITLPIVDRGHESVKY